MGWLWVFLGGGLGSLARYGSGRWLNPAPGGFPLGTLAANVVACLLLGLTAGYLARALPADTQVRMAVIVGFCGGFSTFSTFSFEILQLMEGGDWAKAGLYLLASLAGCLGAVWLGKWAFS